MIAFDPLRNTGKAYELIWKERKFLGRMAVLPLVINLLCYAIIMMTGQEDVFAGMSFYLLPAFFAEGWFIAHVSRLVFYGEYVAPTERSFETQQQRRQSVKAAMVVYTLTRFLVFGAAGLMLNYISEETFEAANASPTFMMFTIVSLALFIGFFKILWLYIPMAVGMPVRTYMYVSRDFAISFRIISTWIACFIPFSLLFSMLIGALIAPYETLAAAPTVIRIIVSLLQTVLELFVTVLSAAAISYGLRSLVKLAKG